MLEMETIKNRYHICQNCILIDGAFGVKVSSNGLCSYCSDPKFITPTWRKVIITDKLKKEKLDNWKKSVREMQERYGSQKFSCVLGYSGGKDSTALVDTFVNEYGSDTFRMYMMFMGSYEEGGDWSDEGIAGINRFIKRVVRLVEQVIENKPLSDNPENFDKVLRQKHYAIKFATQDLERFHFNTAISRIMELVNEIYLYIQDLPPEKQNKQVVTEIIIPLVKLMAPFAPHLTEELWEKLGQEYSIFNSKWPDYDEQMLETDTINLGVQINGKISSQITSPANADDEKIINIALNDEKTTKYVEGKKIVKQFVVQKKLVIQVVK